MATILDELAAYAKERTAKAMRERALSSLRADAEAMPKGDFAFQAAIMKQAHGSPAFICECKKASPSKGLIAPEFPYLQIAQDYERAGADCISVLTEPRWFLGSDRYLQEIASTVSIPLCRGIPGLLLASSRKRTELSPRLRLRGMGRQRFPLESPSLRQKSQVRYLRQTLTRL